MDNTLVGSFIGDNKFVGSLVVGRSSFSQEAKVVPIRSASKSTT
jgi:hypothetical protein